MTTEKKKDAAGQAAELARALAQGRVAREKLNAATDNLNEQLTAAERAIAALKLGVTGSVMLEERGASAKWLTFAKHNDQWRLLAEDGDVFGMAPGEALPLVNAPRSVRLMASRKLGALVTHLVKIMDSEIRAVEESVKATQQFLDSVAEPDPFDDLGEGPVPVADGDIPF